TARARAFPDLGFERPPVGGGHRTRTLSKQLGVAHMGSGSGRGVRGVTAGALAVLLGGLKGMGHPYRLSSDDAISYLAVADAYLRHDWRSVVNGYWSPLCPLLLALAKWVARVGPAGELVLFRIVNFGIYLASIGSFDFFLRRVMAAHEAA